MLERMRSHGNTPALLVGVQTGTATLEISMAITLKFGNQCTSRPSYTTLGHMPKDTQSYHGDTCSTMLIAGIIHNIQKLETTSAEERIKENVVYLHNGVLLVCKKNNGIMKFAGKNEWNYKKHTE